MDIRSLERSGEVAALRGGGELLLIGPWTVFQGVAPALVIRDPARLRTVLYPHLRDDTSLAKLAALYRRLICTGSVAGHYSPQQTAEQMMALMQVGQIAAVALPDTSGNDGNGNIQPAMLTGAPVGPVTQWSLADRFSYVLGQSPNYMPEALGTELRNTLNERTLAMVVGVLVVWAGSHAVGVGFVADAALLAIGFTLAGWAIFDGIKYLIRFFNLTMSASSVRELDQAAEQFAGGVIAIGVGALIALLTRGANRLAPRPVGRSMPRPSAETPHTPRQVADSATTTAARAQQQLRFGENGRKLDFLFNRNINQSNVYNAQRAAGNASRIGIADTAANRAEVISRFNQAYNDPSSIIGAGRIPGSNIRQFFLPGTTGTGSTIEFVEQAGNVITIIAK
ncbi:hypothetical protein [Bordetella petrii]|uniref:hypothetical protein n=1 Tax=Bordetella petrii TaxID=94624 RepID=UPI001E602F49|nr:hypothetical protein [Bordetella petrii]MCD0505062.1 hypothetical protein [Bordetella petrii]